MFSDVFLEDYSDHSYCDICEEERNAYDPVYCCNKCTFNAHIGCALNEIKDKPTSNLVGDKDSTGKLMEKDEINERNANFSPFEIMYCDEGRELMFDEDIKWGARCVGIIPLEMQIQFHPLHALHLLFNPSQRCRVCKGSFEFQKISYGCVQCDDLYLHAYCAKSLKRVLKSKSHTHRLYYFGSVTQAYVASSRVSVVMEPPASPPNNTPRVAHRSKDPDMDVYLPATEADPTSSVWDWDDLLGLTVDDHFSNAFDD
ncbi:hypothetical protein F3Y22_tig00110865pilonHSYRG00417 [Hibiscus syriacus]|uniref:DC1 domain-containing protein n=1 Tax=Hibiscus syriacus TaxID=106335 RepID=A0A6A2ZL74_HIBSY|nr:hypothetical protein F3Y22_tig00110865pilonHSYRG00417 [Hibiscus syriacus]